MICTLCDTEKPEEDFYVIRCGSYRRRRAECKSCYLERCRARRKNKGPDAYMKPRPNQHGFNGWSGLAIAMIYSAFKALDHKKEVERVNAREFLETHRGPWCDVMRADEEIVDLFLKKYDNGEEIAKNLPHPHAVTTRMYSGSKRKGVL